MMAHCGQKQTTRFSLQGIQHFKTSPGPVSPAQTKEGLQALEDHRTLTLVPPLSSSELSATLMVRWQSALGSRLTNKYTQYTWETCTH